MPIGVLFAGQGAQQVGMGRSLYESAHRAQALYDEASAILGWDVRSVSFEGPEDRLTETRICQPALYVHGYALFEVLRDLGKLPQVGAVLGLSLGEFTACAAAGVFDFATGLRIVAERGHLMQQACEVTEGTMASLIGGPRDLVESLAAQHDVDVANYNSPGQIVIAGETPKIRAAAEAAKATGKFKMVIPLKVAGAYHSRLMRPAQDRFARYLDAVPFQRPNVPVIQNIDAALTSDPAAIKRKMVEQVTGAVRWEDCLRTAWGLGMDGFLELGPGGVLAGLARRTDKSWPVRSIAEWSEIAA